ncbi:glycyl-tRNA synthetase, PPC-targeted [Guillardia theta CCMP2712]|uniref:glycine--tRNA ligase n=1 Tax=Guillardia theta (strain CCMP2712) TaxID=905079 RepID=L1ICS8_GUITC|nr:glycyl-tRNA synthetase, PPC-targeted [Guillardia theta CCMP2712]EKX34056.1 glycyl-tRNA synthetase, PPC-targeted [Guillardia theta CCMP2712]|eukprot:XP_005821036.1 glycyl-tRNA synthetase, PPC-targeted [Guillardia theta CCMP2712]
MLLLLLLSCSAPPAPFVTSASSGLRFVSSSSSLHLLPAVLKHTGRITLEQTLRLRGGDSNDCNEFGGYQVLNNEMRESFDTVMKRRFVFMQSFLIHGGVSGLFDYGPIGCSIKNNIVDAWRKFFVVSDGMLEVACPSITPHRVLEASGHVKRFTDLMVRDETSGECFRADKLIEEFCDVDLMKDAKHSNETRREMMMSLKARAGSMTIEQVEDAISTFNITSLSTGAKLSKPLPFNLMFKSTIGPSSGSSVFLRPETAQGIFTNFKRLLEFNGGKLPMTIAQIGKSFRNEIAPKQGLLRQREFEMAEIEHFLANGETGHVEFCKMADVEVCLFSRTAQERGEAESWTTLGQAVEDGIIALAYFLGKTQKFLRQCGIKAIRFRQHRATEMAHYAQDCWDAEVLCSYGWVEVVGHADRACFDLQMHSEATDVPLVAWEQHQEPRERRVVQATIDRALIGKAFRARSKLVVEALEKFAEKEGEEALAFQKGKEEGAPEALKLRVEEEELEIPAACVSFKETIVREHGAFYYPRVVEPSFGLDRLFYCSLEHAFYVRGNDHERTVLGLPVSIAPFQCCMLGLSSNDQLMPIVYEIHEEMRKMGVNCRLDDSAANIGKRYARMDEIGVPFAVTVDFQSCQDGTVTLRERDSMEQVRVPKEEVPQLVRSLCEARESPDVSWAAAKERYPSV